jgi:hypothetical protein
MPATLSLGGNLQLQGTALRFTDASTFALTASVLVVGAGSGGNSAGTDTSYGSGGAAGIVISKQMSLLLGSAYPVIIGAGGAVGAAGQSSGFWGLTATGGYANATGYYGANNALYLGGSNFIDQYGNDYGGGGAGSAGNGQNSVSNGAGNVIVGVGGIGTNSAITGASNTYGVGGYYGSGVGATNKGNGGGGDYSYYYGANGGSGVVILSYASNGSRITVNNGTAPVTTTYSSAGTTYQVHQFNSSANITIA